MFVTALVGSVTRMYPLENCKSSVMINAITTVVGAVLTDVGVKLHSARVGGVISITEP